ncbi:MULTISPECIES: two-component system response regulator RppA [Cyanophyceae]|uniref:two-component system response regulator RppA n=1 Tax=Cyanophyceae TaxID=3028117 RepID=UPI0016833345|nr:MULTISPECIES: two-component system response regulator RppA [Cyanophyceae]MBD1916953.1 response regulator transcription factor [Phormidium sp. FACHB-77]MBD2029804.1 response regulator transcription factor [Phormidium sp. FACHB-322]MBD2050408.1 response regulator transcription factor [Leptolyngbya sp. FACHB-60]
MKILLVDDEVELADPLSRLLNREGYEVDVATSGETGCDLAGQGGYDLLILDWMLPGLSGLEICRQVRSRQDNTPVLFLTAKDTLNDRVDGLDAGADDYLVKPFELRELLARVRALLRRSPNLEAATPTRLTYGDLTLDEANQLAHRQGQPAELSEKETRLLAYLLRHPNQVLTHEQIYQSVWDDQDAPSSNVVAAQMRLLRRKIEPKGTAPIIRTVYGKGYRLGG